MRQKFKNKYLKHGQPSLLVKSSAPTAEAPGEEKAARLLESAEVPSPPASRPGSSASAQNVSPSGQLYFPKLSAP